VAKARKKAKKAKRENALLRYFKETWVELKKVNWPTRREPDRPGGHYVYGCLPRCHWPILYLGFRPYLM